jgi:succinate-semialdehyde dehydrogenase / glutarate-semialdehyde dehydrogenase
MQTGLYINGEWITQSEDTLQVKNPATGEVIADVPRVGKERTIQAIDGASEALKSWSKTTAKERASYLRKLHDLMVEHEDEIAELMTLEMGKPLQESKGEVKYAASFIEWYAEEAKRLYGKIIPAPVTGRRLHVIKQPVGVVAAITPWNFPAAMITRKLGPALAAGCTFIVKPASNTPLTAIKMMELCEKAGIPKGVVNLVCARASDFSDTIMNDSRVRKITFTGSTEVGKQLMKQAADGVKKISLELGGHAPLIVLDDADLDKAVGEAIASKFRNAGQTCICANRFYVQAGIYEEFIERYAKEVNKLKVGNGMEQGTQVGPIIDKAGYEKIHQHVKNAVEKGAQCVVGGYGEMNDNGTYFYRPTVLKDVKSDMLIMNEETFGPIAPIQKFETIDEVIELANDTPYGLAAYLFTENLSRGTKVYEKLDYGIIGWNVGVPSSAEAPFGGMKESGIGREGAQEGIEEYVETKYIAIGVNE